MRAFIKPRIQAALEPRRCRGTPRRPLPVHLVPLPLPLPPPLSPRYRREHRGISLTAEPLGAPFRSPLNRAGIMLKLKQ